MQSRFLRLCALDARIRDVLFFAETVVRIRLGE